jgi:hypothetical protein
MADSDFAPFGTAEDQSWVADFDTLSASPKSGGQPPVSTAGHSLALASFLSEGLEPPEVPDESPYNTKLELPPTFVPFERTLASERLAEFCRTVLGYEPVYAGGKTQSLAGMAALKTVLGITDGDPASSSFE